jgi:nucleoside-diphosphate-sugar epimerase
MKCLVTGSNGFIAKHLINALCSRKEVSAVIGASRHSKILPHEVKTKNSICDFYCDLNDHLAVKELMRCVQPDVVFHLAGIPIVKEDPNNPFLVMQNNTLPTNYLLEYCKADTRFVLASTGLVYGQSFIGNTKCGEKEVVSPISIYAASKLISEEMVEVYSRQGKVKGRIMRLTATVGSGSKHGIIHDFVKKLQGGNQCLEVLGDKPGSCKTFTHVSDVVQAMILSGVGLNSPKCFIFNIGNEDEVTVEQIAEAVMEATNIHKPIHWLGEKANWSFDNRYVGVFTNKIEYYGWKRKYNSSLLAIKQAVKEIIEVK